MTITPNTLLQEVINRKASDLHLVQSYPPTIRVDGQLIQLKIYADFTPQDIMNFFLTYTTKEQQENFALNKELDFGIRFGEYRFRANAYQEKDSVALSLRLIPNAILSIENLGLPTILHTIAALRQGFVLITGQTGQGKSTTMASIINEINATQSLHIVTIEDPIEYIYPKGNCVISQREVKRDTLSFNKALRSILREDPDVIVIGEMRDYETMSIALTLAETGHLVVSTLHTNTASQTIDRIIDVFPEEQQPQVRSQLSTVLRGVLCQRLIPRIEGTGRIVGYEMLFNNPAVASLIREGKTFQLDNVIQTSGEDNMVIFERSLKSLVLSGKISKEVALKYAFRSRLIDELLK